VFPEDDAAAEGQGEVRTVEEKALFSQAYPDVVERYWRDKALAEENKTKSKTPSLPTLVVREMPLHCRRITGA